MFKLENTAKTLALCTLPLFAVCLISSCSHKSVLLLQIAYTPQYILQYVDVKFSVQNLRKFTSYGVDYCFLFSCFGIIKISKSCKI